MVNSLTIAVLVCLAYYVSAVPLGARMRRGSNTDGQGRNHPSQMNMDREANDSRENGEEVEDEDNDDSHELRYGSEKYDYKRNGNHGSRNG